MTTMKKKKSHSTAVSKEKSAAQQPFEEDGVFISKLKARDSQTVTKVVKAYTSHLFNTARGMGLDEEQSKEIVSESWSTFFEIIPRFKGKSKVRTFLFGIFYKKCLEFNRANARLNQYDPIDEKMESKFHLAGMRWMAPPISPDRFTESLESREFIEQCLERLNPTQRMVFLLRVLEQEDYDVICNTMGLSATNVRQLLFRSRNNLRECIESSIRGKRST